MPQQSTPKSPKEPPEQQAWLPRGRPHGQALSRSPRDGSGCRHSTSCQKTPMSMTLPGFPGDAKQLQHRRESRSRKRCCRWLAHSPTREKETDKKMNLFSSARVAQLAGSRSSILVSAPFASFHRRTVLPFDGTWISEPPSFSIKVWEAYRPRTLALCFSEEKMVWSKICPHTFARSNKSRLASFGIIRPTDWSSRRGKLLDETARWANRGQTGHVETSTLFQPIGPRQPRLLVLVPDMNM